MPHRAGHGGVGGGRRWCMCIATRSGVCPWALMFVIANSILIVNRRLQCLKGIVGSYHVNIYDDYQRIRSNGVIPRFNEKQHVEIDTFFKRRPREVHEIR